MSQSVLNYLTSKTEVTTYPWGYIVVFALIMVVLYLVLNRILKGVTIITLMVCIFCLFWGLENSIENFNTKELAKLPSYYNCATVKAEINQEQYDDIINNMKSDTYSIIDLKNIKGDATVGNFKTIVNSTIKDTSKDGKYTITLRVYALKDNLTDYQKKTLKCPRSIAELESIS